MSDSLAWNLVVGKVPLWICLLLVVRELVSESMLSWADCEAC